MSKSLKVRRRCKEGRWVMMQSFEVWYGTIGGWKESRIEGNNWAALKNECRNPSPRSWFFCDATCLIPNSER
jgi:hypothetical protein